MILGHAGGKASLEIITPIHPESDVAKFLSKKGERIYAVAFEVRDAGKAKKKAEAMGMRVVGDIRPKDLRPLPTQEEG